MKLKPFISRLKGLPKRLNSAAEKPFRANFPLILKDLQSRSPVDRGQYKSSWKMREGSKKGLIVANVVFYNDDPKARLMEFGSETGVAPWYYPNQAKTGKLTVASGRVWAGGLKPGHQHTIGGAINPVLYKNNQRQLEIAQKVANAVMRRV